VGQKLLEAVFGEDAVRRLARTARDDLSRRCRALLAAEQERFLARLDPDAGNAAVELAEHARALTRLADAT
ncbi:MAG TPA: ABC transporter, partial [Arthrobacter sp.]|nr:ABC transporter [Arthrobacter sp.]